MTVTEALTNALIFLEELGYLSGDIYDDLVLARNRIAEKHPSLAKEEL